MYNPNYSIFSLTFKEVLKSAFLIFVCSATLIIGSHLLGISWLFINVDFAESNSFMTKFDPIVIWFLLIVMPLSVAIEELIFRFLPYKLSLKLQNKYFWIIGIISSLGFAYLHGFPNFEEFTGFPTIQFLIGLYLWRYIPSGYKNVFLIHLIYNILIIALSQIFGVIGI